MRSGMHELSIAAGIVDIAEEEVALAGACRVLAVRLRLGALAGVARDALLFSFDIVAAGTVVEGARLEIEDIPVVIACPICQAERALPAPSPLCCPVCGTPTPAVVRGTELEVTALEIDDGPSPAHHRAPPASV